MKRLICRFIVCVLFFSVPCKAQATSSYILIEASSGRVLASENENLKLPMASLTKIMTAYTVIENANLNDIVTITKESAGIEGSSMYIKVGEKYSVEELLYGLMLVSGNDAATALAYHIGGSVDGFATLMNEQAKKLQLKNTQFKNPSGLDAQGHYTTASDLATLTSIALNNAIFSKIVSTKQIKIHGKMLVNHNRLLREIDGCIGVKTGYTKACGRCLVSAVKKDDVTLICVTLNRSNDWAFHKNLYNENFKRCKKQLLISEKEIYRAIKVANGYDVGYYCPSVYGVVIDGKIDFSVSIKVPDFIYHKKVKGDTIGTLLVEDGTNIVATSDLILDRDTKSIERKKSKIRKLFDLLLHLFGF